MVTSLNSHFIVFFFLKQFCDYVKNCKFLLGKHKEF
jgi:hypothetical protein